jgi:choline-sulfatase
MLGSHGLWAKMNFYAPSVQVPLLIRPPGGIAPRTEHALAELTDVMATLAAIGRADAPAGGVGRSLLAALDGDLPGRQQLFSQIGNFAAVRTDRYRATVHLPSGTPCELFDLADDPGETRNRVADRSTSETLNDLVAALSAHHASVD